MAREAAGEHQRNQETAVSCRSLTALSAPIIYLVGSQLCVKMQLLSQATTNIFRLFLNFTAVYEQKPLKESLTSSSTGSRVLYSKSALGKNSAQEVGRRSG
jgi:hypothetical protein